MTRKYTNARKDSNRKWDANNLDRMSIAVPKGMRDIIKAHAESQGESANSFINRAISETMARDAAGTRGGYGQGITPLPDSPSNSEQENDL